MSRLSKRVQIDKLAANCSNVFLMVILLAFALSWTGCESPEDELTQLIKKSLRGDATITDNEWMEIVRLAETIYELSSYQEVEELCSLINEIGLELSKSERNPLPYPPSVDACLVQKPKDSIDTFNVYLENSASMDGYMNGLTEFKEVLYHILTELKGQSKNINFAFINEETHDFDTKEINEFIDFLKPSNMRGMGNRGDTELNYIIRNVLEQYHQDNNPVILISDYIFSVKDLRSIDGDLPKAKYTLKAEIQKLDGLQNAILVMKYESKFSGTYYDYRNKPYKIDDTRPYYIWLIGPMETVTSFMEDYYITRAEGFKEYFVIANDDAFSQPYFSVLGETEKKGRFRKCRGQQGGCLEDIRFVERGEDEGVFQFSVAIDLKNIPIADSYKMLPRNYVIEAIKADELQVVDVLPISDIEPNDERYQGSATHILVLSTNNNNLSRQNQEVKIKFRNTIPNWIETSSTLDDTKIESDPTLLGKTFGFEYLVTGAFEALNSPALDKCFFWEIPIRINNE